MKEFVTAFGPKKRVSIETTGPSRTHQSFKDECDINNILANYQRTGVLRHQEMREANYGEFAEVDFHGAMQMTIDAQEAFMRVPSELRKRFHNDPGEFFAFVNDEANAAEMVELGLSHAPLDAGQQAVVEQEKERGKPPAEPPAE